MTPITIMLDGLRTMTESNTGGHWTHKYQRGKMQRELAYYALKEALVTPAVLPLPLTITITRIAPKMLDIDNCISSFKHLGDGIVDFVLDCPGEGHRFDNDPRLTWRYAQRRGGVRQYAVELTFATTPAPAPTPALPPAP